MHGHYNINFSFLVTFLQCNLTRGLIIGFAEMEWKLHCGLILHRGGFRAVHFHTAFFSSLEVRIIDLRQTMQRSGGQGGKGAF
jgi:hypothetical protein